MIYPRTFLLILVTVFAFSNSVNAQSITLAQLPYIKLNAISTLMIPPAKALSLNHQVLQQLGITAANIG